jgi:hypothetical protein
MNYPPIFISPDGLSAKCPICGVWSNFFPDYPLGSSTAVVHVLGYCGHILNEHTGSERWPYKTNSTQDYLEEYEIKEKP